MFAKSGRCLGRFLLAALFLASVNRCYFAFGKDADMKPVPPAGPAQPAVLPDSGVVEDGPAATSDQAADKASTAKTAAANATTVKAAAPKPAAPKTAVKKVKLLSPEMVERRDRIRQVLTALRGQPFSTQQNTCTDILDFCRAFGCQTELSDTVAAGQKVNGVTCLCWDMPCAGYNLLTVSEGHLAARVGYGYQARPSELTAVLGLSHVPATYPARAGKTVRTVADLIAYEKLTCHSGTDMSLKLVTLANYVEEPSWKNDLGEEWTLQRLVKEELDRPQSTYPHAATDRLLGLSVALERFKEDHVSLEGDLNRAKVYVDDSIAYAYAAQNTDGSWGRPSNRDYAAAVANTARMMEWLVTALPSHRLEDPQIVHGIDCLYTLFNTTHYQTYIANMSSREISAAMHAAYVLNTYDHQVFAGAEAAPPKTANPPQSASLPAESR